MPTPETLDFSHEPGPYGDEDIEWFARKAITASLVSDPEFMAMSPEERTAKVTKLFRDNFAYYMKQAREHWQETQGRKAA